MLQRALRLAVFAGCVRAAIALWYRGDAISLAGSALLGCAGGTAAWVVMSWRDGARRTSRVRWLVRWGSIVGALALFGVGVFGWHHCPPDASDGECPQADGPLSLAVFLAVAEAWRSVTGPIFFQRADGDREPATPSPPEDSAPSLPPARTRRR